MIMEDIMNEILTIFTPAFNRAHTLERLYKSLLTQKEKEFLWLVIDDGSTDNTKEVIEALINEDKIKIEYVYQANAGKQAAWNKALKLCQTEFFMCLDSDDALTDDAATHIYKFIPCITNDSNIIGLRFNAINTRINKIESKYFSNEAVIKSWFDEVSNDKYVGDKIDVFKTALIKNFIFPVNNNIKFIPESWMYSSVANAGFKFMYIPTVILLIYDFDRENRLSKSSIKIHAQGHYISRSNLLKVIPKKVFIRNPLFFIKTLIRFAQTARLTKKKFYERYIDCNSVICTLMSYIFGFFPLR